MTHTACLVYFISTVNSHRKKKPIQTGASSGHITNLKQSILETSISMNIYVLITLFLELNFAMKLPSK